MRSTMKRGGLALLLASVGIVGSVGVAQPASAGGVYFCYETGPLITVGHNNVNYLVPKAVTTDPSYCPPGTTAIGVG